MKKFSQFFIKWKKLKIFLIFLILFWVILFAIGCNNQISKEGKSENKTQQTVLVELYVVEGCLACAIVEPIFEQLADEYAREERILVGAAPWGNYHTSEIRQRFDWYALTPAGVPQMMFNGLSDSNVGVLDESTIRDKIETQLSMEAVIELKASRTSNGISTVFTGTVKNIGNQTLTNLVVNGMAFMDRGKKGFHYSVVDIFGDEKKLLSAH